MPPTCAAINKYVFANCHHGLLQLLREASAHDWSSARSVLGTAAASFEDTFVDPMDVMAATAQQSGQRLGGRNAGLDARSAAVQSAAQRGSVAAAGSIARAPVSAQQDISGLGHRDDVTEELEQQMRELGSPKADSAGAFADDQPSDGSADGEPVQRQEASAGSSQEAHKSPQDSSPEDVIRDLLQMAPRADAEKALHTLKTILQVGHGGSSRNISSLWLLCGTFDTVPEYDSLSAW